MLGRTMTGHGPTRVSRLLLFGAIAACALLALPAAASAATFDPLNIITDEVLRGSSSMSRADIQAFLDAQPGVLKSYSCAEGGPNGLHSTVVKPASQIIFEAAQYWNVNPKLILSTLEKEQSLISQPYHVSSPTHTYGTDYHLTNAMGCGVYATSPDRHPGFGDQVWTGTQKLGQTWGAYAWYAGKAMRVWSYPAGAYAYIVPANQPTWNLYTYTPYYPQQNVWTIWNRYFGDPASPPRLRPVYRFYNRTTGAYFYTTSEAERWRVIARRQSWIRYQGAQFSIDTSAPTNVVPLYRLYSKMKQRYFYTASTYELARLLRLTVNGVRVYRSNGVIAYVSLTGGSGPSVYRLYCPANNTHIWTASSREKYLLIASGRWRYQGVAFFLGRYVPPPPPPSVPATSTATTPTP